MSEIKGSINVSTENIFPVIRQWLYTDKDIFIREIISNAADAITKLEHLRNLQEWKESSKPEYRIDVVYDSNAGTISISDNGIGMSLAEIDEFINQIAYSGAIKFIEKYEDKSRADGVIGHFGLGFYSSFMVAEKVRIESKSYQENEPAAYWESKDGVDYVMGEFSKAERGTKIIIFLDAASKAEFDALSIRRNIIKYCEYMPYPIYFRDLIKEDNEVKNNADDKIRESDTTKETEEHIVEDKDNSKVAEKVSGNVAVEEQVNTFKEVPINDVKPLWNQNPSDCSEEDYVSFYKKFFRTMDEPLFWIHLNMDYPFRMKGILYFPHEEKYIEDLSGRIKVFYNQVFVADDVREIIPDYLFLLKGCIDSPDLPLNVSRSALQNNSTLTKVKDYISRKVADRLKTMAKKERETYSSYWKDLSTFVKYASLKDEKFFDRVEEAILFENTAGEFTSLKDFETLEKEKIYYTSDQDKQDNYIQYWLDNYEEVYILNHEIDSTFIDLLNFKLSNKKFIRVDADILGDDADENVIEQIKPLFAEILKDTSIEINVKALGKSNSTAMLLEDEDSRRMSDMQKMYMQMQGGTDAPELPIKRTLVLNSDAKLFSKLKELSANEERKDLTNTLAVQIYDLAKLGHGSLNSGDLSNFIKRSESLLNDLI